MAATTREQLQRERDEAVGALARLCLFVDHFFEDAKIDVDKIHQHSGDSKAGWWIQQALRPSKSITDEERVECFARVAERLPRNVLGKLLFGWYALRNGELKRSGIGQHKGKHLEELMNRGELASSERRVLTFCVGSLPSGFLPIRNSDPANLHERSDVDADKETIEVVADVAPPFGLLEGAVGTLYLGGSVGHKNAHKALDWSRTPLGRLAKRLFPKDDHMTIQQEAFAWSRKGGPGPKGSRRMRALVRVLIELCGDADNGLSEWLKRMWGINLADESARRMLREDWLNEEQETVEALLAWAVGEWGHEAPDGKGVAQAVDAMLSRYGLTVPRSLTSTLTKAAEDYVQMRARMPIDGKRSPLG